QRAESGYVGFDVYRASRICAAGHGGQVLLSQATRELVANDLPNGVSLQDLGEHRLRDIAQPHHLFQIAVTGLPTEFPALRSLDVLPNNLPRQLTSFIGREREIAEIKRLLATSSLLTLTGSGGAGKTRLAMQAASESLDAFADGVWVVELAALADPALVLQTVAAALGLREYAGRAMTETLVDYLRPRSLLVVLDNCEHVLKACSTLAEALLRGCPHLKLLVTSREPLSVPGEKVWRTPSLSLPDPQRAPSSEELAHCEAARLFVERAIATQPTFAVTAGNANAVAQICRRLNGIPLAIELAAARIKVLSAEQIAVRLDDSFRLLTGGSRTGLPRQQTLRAAMDWSYDLLSDQERGVLRRLSVFAGGWTLEAAEAVCAAESVEAADVLDLITQLVDKSLVVAETQGGEARYRLLETVRQYGRTRLAEAGEATGVAIRHRDWFLQHAERAEPEFFGPEQRTWLDRLETEHDNLRVALEWSKAEPAGAEAILRLAGALTWFWFIRGHWREGRRWLESALARSADAPPAALPRAIHGATFFAWRQSDYKRAAELGKQGLAVCREVGDRQHMGRLLVWLGITAMRETDYGRATSRFEEGLAIARALGDKWLIGLAQAQVGIVAQVHGDLDRAITLHTESLALGRETEDAFSITYNLRNLGKDTLQQGDDTQAGAYFAECLTLSREIGHRWITEECLDGLARVACARRQYERAASLFGAADALTEAIGHHRSLVDQADHDKRVTATRAGLSAAAFNKAWAQGRAMTLERAIECALATTNPVPSSSEAF
ncbi:MAG TPA: adenylate/guanylate cyclase domain-containing protein, partial [bacterium]|nr:adenylate/guanylate cyclase domain-containing protein [bacterium]